MQIKDRTFVISGGSSGLGLATTVLLLAQGGYVSILDLQPPVASDGIDSSRILFSKTDVSSSSSLEAAVKATLQWVKSTGKPLAGTICSAGIGSAALSLPKQAPDATHETVKYMDMGPFDKVLAVNLRGTVDLIRLTLPHLSLNQGWGPDEERGVIIVVSSVAAFEGQVGQLAYSASKGAVRSIVLPLARELGKKTGIRVMGIAPGVFHTGLTVPPKKKEEAAPKPKGATGARAGMNTEMIGYPNRMGRGDEFASLVREIIVNPMINGDVIRLDGGVRMPSRL